MLEALITSKTRIKLILKFFLNPEATSYLRGLAEEFGESSNAIRVELNRFEDAGLLTAEAAGNKKMFKANTKHPLFADLQSLVRKTMGIDKLIEKVIKELGHVEKAYLTGAFARGQNGQTLDVLLIGDDINKEYLIQLIDKAEEVIARKIRYLVLSNEDALDYLNKIKDKMLIWSQ